MLLIEYLIRFLQIHKDFKLVDEELEEVKAKFHYMVNR